MKSLGTGYRADAVRKARIVAAAFEQQWRDIEAHGIQPVIPITPDRPKLAPRHPTPPMPSAPPADKTLRQAFELFRSDPGKQRTRKTDLHYLNLIELTVGLWGESRTIRSIDREASRELLDVLLWLPANAEKKFPKLSPLAASRMAKEKGLTGRLSPASVNRQRTLPIDRINKKEAKAEIEAVAALYAAFRAGKPVPSEHVIPAERLGDRLDAKAFEPTGQMLSTWKAKGITTKRLSDILEPVDTDGDDAVDLGEETEEVSYLVVGYDGFAREGEVIATDKKTSGALLKVREDQLVLSHINAVNGSICVVPDYLDGRVITSEFSAFTTKPGYDPRAVWAVLRSPEVRAELLLRASGAGRTRVKWKSIADLEIALPDAKLTKSVVDALKKAEAELRAAQETRKKAQEQVQAALILSSDRAVATLAAFKPPR